MRHHYPSVLVLAGWQFSRLFNCGSVSGPFWQKIGLEQRALFKKPVLRRTPPPSRHPSHETVGVFDLSLRLLCFIPPANNIPTNQPLRTCQHPANAGKVKNEYNAPDSLPYNIADLPNQYPTSYQTVIVLWKIMGLHSLVVGRHDNCRFLFTSLIIKQGFIS